MKKQIILLMSVIIVACTQHSPLLNESQKAEAEKQIREISTGWLELSKKNDFAGVRALFADDAVVYHSNEEPSTGVEAINEYFIRDAARNPKRIFDWKTDKVIVTATGDYAVEYGSYTFKQMGTEGMTDDSGKFVTVYRNVNGIWKVYTDIGTSTKPVNK